MESRNGGGGREVKDSQSKRNTSDSHKGSGEGGEGGMEGGWKREEKWGKTKNGKGIAKREEHQPQYCRGRGEEVWKGREWKERRGERGRGKRE